MRFLDRWIFTHRQSSLVPVRRLQYEIILREIDCNTCIILRELFRTASDKRARRPGNEAIGEARYEHR